MADGFYRVQWIFPMDSGLPEDEVVNTWSFKHLSTADHAADATAMVSRLTAFYTDILAHYSSRVNVDACRYRIFDLAESQPRIPFAEDQVDLGASTSSNVDLPPEVAICLSFKAASASGANARRRRGRVYIGPLQTTSTADYHEVLSTTVTAIGNAADVYIAGENDDLVWCVYSPYTHHGVPVGEKLSEAYPEVPGNLLNAFPAVQTIWVDNAYDTQRRRGVKATSRTTYFAP